MIGNAKLCARMKSACMLQEEGEADANQEVTGTPNLQLNKKYKVLVRLIVMIWLNVEAILLH